MNRTIQITALVALAVCSACTSKDTATPGINAPSNLKVEALDGGAHLTWQDNSDNESQFMIERMTDATDWSTVGMVPFNTTQYHDPNLTPGTMYMYRVMAMPPSGGKGAYCSQVTFAAPSPGAAGPGGAGAAGASAHGHT